MRKSLLFLLYWAYASVAGAVTVPGIDLVGFVRDSDIIAVGTIATVEFERDVTIDLASGSTMPAREMRATFSVDQLLKGSTNDRLLDLRFEVPESYMGYGSVRSGDFIVVFLKEHERGYEFVSPYEPAITAVPGAQAQGSDAISRVLSLLTDGLRMGTQPAVKMEILRAIRGIDNPIVINGLNALVSDANPAIRTTAWGYLLLIGQIDVLPMVEAALADGTSFDRPLLNNLRSSVASGVRSEAAIPVLERLLQSPQTENRRAAAYALSRIESSLIVEPLTRALDDSDFDVRLDAVRGLAKILDQSDPVPRPSANAFRADEQRYIAPLRSLRARPLEAR